ncbi:MAG TPA: TIM-barrel domain-containing protein [Gemmatimonadaceae bacterium]|nr:TIM-barrel domain-containing protein [Gemmatimonadaceae bacterium]
MSFRTSRIRTIAAALCSILAAALSAAPASAQNTGVLGDPVDVGQDFKKPFQPAFVASRLTAFDPATGRGSLQWDRYALNGSLSFEKEDVVYQRAQGSEFPGAEYDRDPSLPFEVSFVSPRALRLRFSTRALPQSMMEGEKSIMLAGPVPTDKTWQVQSTDSAVTYTSAFGRVRIVRNPWDVQIYDAQGKLLTRTTHLNDPAGYLPSTPFSFVRRGRDYGRTTAATFELQQDEKIFGFGESFTRLNKRGQRIVAFLRDAMGVQGSYQYKAIPFFLSSRGYGMFVHTSAPVTFDVGAEYDAHNVIYSGDEMMDIFVFLGEPKDVVSEYTALTGRSPVPPLWSFGLWMSRITYKSEAEVRDVAAKLRQYKVPADVLHLDTGWFETDWQSDYKFSKTRFTDPAKMIADLKKDGFHVSLWQYTYFTPKNSLFKELVDEKLTVRDQGGRLSTEDAVLDFTNPATVAWYKNKLAGLLKMGVSVIKADFGEGAPLEGQYHNGRTGWYEHNLYPVRYNDAAWSVTKQITGDGIIWGRSAWAGSQRYPLHWGGDAENTNSAMAAELRGGLSFGLSGFTYWSHDVGGFVARAPADLYRRWLAMGVLTSHTRTHGAPPREPWEYSPAMVTDFQNALGLKYSLMPYIYSQAHVASSKGWPMLRTLFFEYPDDPGSWLVEDEYMFGANLLVAPLLETATAVRRVYLPPGTWIDYQTGKSYEGARYHTITAGTIPIVLLVKDHTVLPHVAVAQNTAAIDWKNVELKVYSSDGAAAEGTFILPGGTVQTLRVNGSALVNDPLAGKVTWRVTRPSVTPASN